MMGNQRQLLKENIGMDLKTKIENAQVLLTKFKSEQDNMEKTCVQAKAQIQDTADLIVQQLTQRQTTLIKAVELRAQTHANNLQTNIQNTYLALGSLQSILSNLDSFDNSQLLNLQIPNSSNLPYSVKSRLGIDTNCEQVLEKIQHWGGVDLEEDIALDSEFVAVLTSSDIFDPMPELLPIPSTSELETKITKDGIGSAELQRSDIQQWLEAKSEIDVDDFERVSDYEMFALEQEDQLLKMHPGSEDSIVPDIDDKTSTFEGMTAGTEDSSSIACVDNVQENLAVAGTLDDLSMWLKPRTSPNSASKDVAGFNTTAAPVPPEMIQKTQTTSTVSSKSRFFDYPGLRLDPRCWLPKKPRAQFKLSTELALNMSEKEIIPPTYAALPYPFWLKRC